MHLPDDHTEFLEILSRYERGEANLSENEFVERYFTYLETRPGGLEAFSAEERDRIELSIFSRLQNSIHSSKPVIHRVHFLRRYRWAAAAVFLFAMATTYLFVFNKQGKPGNDIAKIDVKAPQKNRAMITLANGKTVYLDSAANGRLATFGNVKLVKLADGQVAYSGTSDKIEYNTITNPKGSKVIDMAFVDGSHVWLNAGSSVTYPVPFEGNERKVKISGEAYFEIAHDASKPFKVAKGDMEVTVFGTHFNVNAYDDESDIKVTLLEGSVKVSKGSANSMLKPGEQAQIPAKDGTGANRVSIVNSVDIEQVMAWKEGQFIFENTDISTIMRQIGRWYDVQIVYQGEIPDRGLGGSMPRTENAGTLLGVLEETGIVHFTMEGDKITVLPGKRN